jgi:hypothetical protein
VHTSNTGPRTFPTGATHASLLVVGTVCSAGRALIDLGIRTTASQMAVSGPPFPPLRSSPAKRIVGFTGAECGGRTTPSGIMVGRMDGADCGATDIFRRTTILAVAGLSGMLAERGLSGMVVGRDGRLGLGAEGRRAKYCGDRGLLASHWLSSCAVGVGGTKSNFGCRRALGERLPVP